MSSITLSLALRGRLLSGYQTTLQGALFGNNEPGFTFEPWDITTLYQDRAGTTPVTAAGQSVGLRLDKSKGLALGPELVTNGDFSAGATGWTLGTDWSISGGFASRGANVTASNLTGGSGVEVGKTYRVTWTQGAEAVAVYLGSAAGPLVLNTATAGTYSRLILATVTGGVVFRASASVSSIDNISVRELAGNHEVAINDASRGIYGWMPKTGRRNLLTYTEQFDNAAWVKGGVTVTANATVAPDGTMTADLLTGTGATPRVYHLATLVSGATYTASIYVKQGTSPTVTLDVVNIQNGPVFTFATKSWGPFGGNITSVGFTELANGWFRLRATFLSNTTSAGPGWSVGGTTTASIWGAQLELGSTATAYQRVVSNYDITEAGVPSCHYVLANGVNTAYVTPTITPNTDKVQVFAGVRKNSDAASAILVEFSATFSSNNGTFALWSPLNAGAISYAIQSRGTATGTGGTGAAYLSPITNVVTGIGSISGDIASIRVNGGTIATGAADQGTGNYLAYPAYIYARGGTTLPFNGYDFGHAVRFGPNLDAATIARVESLIARNTPEVTL